MVESEEITQIAEETKPEVEVLTPVSESSLLVSTETTETMNSTIVNSNKANTSAESHSDKNSQNLSIAVSEISENMYYSADETNQAQTSLSDFESFKVQSSSSTSPASSKSSETKEEESESNEASFSENAENKTLHDDAVELKETTATCVEDEQVEDKADEVPEVKEVPEVTNEVPKATEEKVEEDFVFVEPQATSDATETVVEQQEALMKCDSTLFFKDGRQNVEEVLNRSFEMENTTSAAATESVEKQESEAEEKPVESEMASNEVEVKEAVSEVVHSLVPQESPLDLDIESELDISTTSIGMENKVTIVETEENELSGSSKTASTNSFSDFEMSVNFSFKPSSSVSDEEPLKASDLANLKSLESSAQSESSERSGEDKSESLSEMVNVDLGAPAENLVEKITVEKFNEIESQELSSLVNKIVSDVISNAVAVAPNPLMLSTLNKDETKVNEVNLESELKEAIADETCAEKKEAILNANSLTPVSSSLSMFKKLSPAQAVKAKLNDKKQVVASDVDCFGCTIV